MQQFLEITIFYENKQTEKGYVNINNIAFIVGNTITLTNNAPTPTPHVQYGAVKSLQLTKPFSN